LAVTSANDGGNKTNEMNQCNEYVRLRADVENVLGNLAQVTTLTLELFRAGDFDAVKNLDQQIELAVGEKERCLGALRQHLTEHNCQHGKKL